MRDRFVGNDRGSVQRAAERKETAKRVPRHREHIKEFKREIKKDDESARRSVAGKFFEATTSERCSARDRCGKVFATTPTRNVADLPLYERFRIVSHRRRNVRVAACARVAITSNGNGTVCISLDARSLIVKTVLARRTTIWQTPVETGERLRASGPSHGKFLFII